MFTNGPYRQLIPATLLVLLLGAGCSSTRNAIPAYCVRPSFGDHPRGDKQPIDLSLLRQEPPAVYQLGPGDILGIFIEGVLSDKRGGGKDEVGVDVPPILQRGEKTPQLGFPIPVREDGTLSLPWVPPIDVTGLTLAQAEEEIRKAYTVDQRILQPPRDRIIITLLEPRKYHVIVVREDGMGPEGRPFDNRAYSFSPTGSIMEPPKVGVAKAVDLDAYENDVLHALAKSGGLPGVAAKSELKIVRGAFKNPREREQYLRTIQDPVVRAEVEAANKRIVRIPLRVGPGDLATRISREDIMLDNGDIVYIESREQEVFYTGGLLRGGQFPVPRDYDLDVLGAIAMAGGSVAMVAGGSTGTSGRGGASGIFPPTRVTVLRTVDGEQTAIRVDLKRAASSPQERILVQPNDFILLEYTPIEVTLNVVMNTINLNLSLNQLFQ